MAGLSDDQIRALLADPMRAPPCARDLGFELIDFSVADRWAEMAFQPRPEFANPAGGVQGGFVTAMLDDCVSFTATVASRFELMFPTLQMVTQFIRPVPIARVVARGEVVRMGATSAQMQGALRLADGTLLATAMASAVPRPFPR